MQSDVRHFPVSRVLKSDSLSTHLDQKSVVARFEKSADERDVEGRIEFHPWNICVQSGVVTLPWWNR